MKHRHWIFSGAWVLAASLGLVMGAHAQPARSDTTAPRSKPARAAPELEAKAMDLLRAMGTALTSSSSMSFTAVATYESPTVIGPPLAFTTTSEVLVQRPNKLRVITSGDGKASEYYYDGKTLTAFAPSENLVAVAPAPPTIDAMLEAAFKNAAIYFPFADVLGADPFKDLAAGLTKAFYVGDSRAVGGTTTDVIAVVSDELFMQIWIGADDKLPRRLRATYRGDPMLLRHQVDLSNWKLDPVVAAEAFASVNAVNARKISFAVPNTAPPAAKSRAGKPGKAP
jgi:hypothetical protein